jgi:hypothetical protein
MMPAASILRIWPPGIVDDVQLAVSADGDAPGPTELCLSGGSAVARGLIYAGADDRGDPAVGLDLPDASVVGVGDVEVACGVHRHPHRDVELFVTGRAAVAAETRCAIPGDRGDDARPIDSADPVVPRVRDVEVAVTIEMNALWAIKLGLAGGTAIASEPPGLDPGHRRDDARRVDPTDPVAPTFGADLRHHPEHPHPSEVGAVRFAGPALSAALPVIATINPGGY